MKEHKPLSQRKLKDILTTTQSYQHVTSFCVLPLASDWNNESHLMTSLNVSARGTLSADFPDHFPMLAARNRQTLAIVL
jgi:hypothetical protein